MFELSLVFLNNLKWHGSFSFASCRCNLGCKPSLKSWRLKSFDQWGAWERSSLTNERPGQPSESRVRCGSSGNIRPTREPFPELPGSWQWTIGRKMNCLHAHTQEGELYRMYIVLDCSSMSTNKILSMYRVSAFDWSIILYFPSPVLPLSRWLVSDNHSRHSPDSWLASPHRGQETQWLWFWYIREMLHNALSHKYPWNVLSQSDTIRCLKR